MGGRRLRRARAGALALALVVLAWQGWNASRGRFVHRFLPADLVLAPLLILAAWLPDGRRAAVALLAGFAAFAGVFLGAAGSALIDGWDPGKGAAAVGLFACVVLAVDPGRELLERAP